MPRRPKKISNLEQGEIDGFDRKIRRTEFILKCSGCNQIDHNISTCKMAPTTQPTQGNQRIQQTQDNQPSQPIQ